MKQETAEKIFQSCEVITELEKLTNLQLSDLLMETVWAELNIFSPHSDLIMEAIERLKK